MALVEWSRPITSVRSGAIVADDGEEGRMRLTLTRYRSGKAAVSCAFPSSPPVEGRSVLVARRFFGPGARDDAERLFRALRDT